MTRRRESETRRVDDPQALHTKDSCLRVDDGHSLVRSTHHACKFRQHTIHVEEDQTLKFLLQVEVA